MNYQEARSFIDEASKSGITLGLDNIKKLLHELGNPQDELKFIHIAGTNGKGSVLAYTSTILEIAGYKTGRYISPTVKTYRERIQINRTNISKEDFAKGVSIIKKAIKKMTDQGNLSPSVFEIETALGFWYFKNQGCDIVVMETGMGGVNDATNVVKNTLACIFTTVSRDHMEYLGNTTFALTQAKAGIIKPGAHIILGQLPDISLKIFKDLAQPHQNPIHLPDWEAILIHQKQTSSTQTFSYKELSDITINLLGHHQITNAILAITTIQALKQKGFPVTDDKIKSGLAQTSWFGRISILQEKNPTIILDGAHNQEAIRALAQTLKSFPAQKITGVMGVFKDKEITNMLAEIAPIFHTIHAIALPDAKRSLTAEELATHIKQAGIRWQSHQTLESALETAIKETDVLVIFGSLSHLGAAQNWVFQNRK